MQRLRGSRWVGEGAGLEETCVHFRSGQQVNRSRCGRHTCTQTSEPCARSDCLAPCERAVGDHCNAGKPPAPDHRPSKVYLSQTKSIAPISPELIFSSKLRAKVSKSRKHSALVSLHPNFKRGWCLHRLDRSGESRTAKRSDGRPGSGIVLVYSGRKSLQIRRLRIPVGRMFRLNQQRSPSVVSLILVNDPLLVRI